MAKHITVTDCPNCGAPVDPRAIGDPDNPSCPFCHTLLPVAADPVPVQVFTPFTPMGSGLIGTPFVPQRRRRGLVITVVGLVIVTTLAAVAVPLLLAPVGGSSRVGFSGSIVYAVYGSVVPAQGRASSHDAYVIAPNVDTTSTPVLRRVDLETHTIKWSTAALPPDSSLAPTVVSAGARAVVIDGTNVFAFDSSSGKRLWQSSISYDLQGNCAGGCAIVIGADLVTLARDGTVAGTDITHGKQLWSRRLPDTPTFLRAARGLAAVVSSPKAPAHDLMLFNPSNGTERTIAPSCAPDGQGDLATPDSESAFFISPDGTSFTVLIDSSGGCVAGYRIADGKLLWRTAPDAQNSQIPFSLTAESAVSGGGYVAWTNEIGSDRWVFVATATGGARRLIDTGSQNETTGLDGIVGDTLVLEIAPSYASDQPGIYGVSLKTGHQLWMDASRVKSSTGDGSQMVMTTPTAIVIISCESSVDGSSGSCRFEAANLSTGDIDGTLDVDQLNPAPTIGQITPGPSGVIANIDSTLVIDFGTSGGTLEGQWPPAS